MYMPSEQTDIDFANNLKNILKFSSDKFVVEMVDGDSSYIVSFPSKFNNNDRINITKNIYNFKDGTIKIRSMLAGCNNIDIVTSSDESIENIRQKVHYSSGIPLKDVHLLHNGKKLFIGNLLSDYKIRSGSIVYLVVKVCDGMYNELSDCCEDFVELETKYFSLDE